MANDLQVNAYRLIVQFLKKWFLEGILVVLVVISVVASMISWNRAERAIDDAKEAIAISGVWQSKYSETERECRLAQMEIDDFRILMAKAGLDEHIGEKP